MSTFTSTFTASNGAQSKTLAHTFTVYATSPITLSATFPASPKVGDAVNFDVTATLADGATGTLTITADTLPAGLSLGATSQVDATHYKATVSGTLTTAATGATNFGATGGSVAAQTLEWDWTVSAAASGPELVRIFPFTFSDYHATTIPFDVGVQAGDKVILLVSTSANRTVSSITNPAGTAWVKDASIQGANSTYAECWSADITADAASWQPVLTPSASGYFHITVYLVRGKTIALDAANVVTNSEIVTGAQTVTIGPYSTSGPALVFLELRTYCTSGTGQVTIGDSHFTTDHTDLFASRNSYTEAHALFDAAQSGNTLDVTTAGGNTTVSRIIVPYTYS